MKTLNLTEHLIALRAHNENNRLEMILDVISSVEVIVHNGELFLTVNGGETLTALNCDHVVLREARL